SEWARSECLTEARAHDIYRSRRRGHSTWRTASRMALRTALNPPGLEAARCRSALQVAERAPIESTSSESARRWPEAEHAREIVKAGALAKFIAVLAMTTVPRMTKTA